MMLESVLEPVVLGAKPDQDTGRLAMPRDDDLAVLGQSQVSRQVILHLGQRDLTAREFRAPRATTWLRLS